MRILGVDCGSRATGYGIIEVHGSGYGLVDSGAIRPGARDSMARRLQLIYQGLVEIIRRQNPDVAVFESVFHAANAQSALKLGHVRGVSIFAAAQARLPVHEYTALQVKSAVTGYGRAEKSQVQEMVRLLLDLAEAPEPYDASDALAVAICHAHTHRYRQATAIQ